MSDEQMFWRSPAGVIHTRRRCPLAADPPLMRPVFLTWDRFRLSDRCDCCWWRERARPIENLPPL